MAAFSAYALNGLFASLVPGFTTVILHHPDYAVAGGVTCVFFAAGAVAALGLAPFNSRPVLLGGLGLFLVGLALVVAGMSAASLALSWSAPSWPERLRRSGHRHPVRRQPAGGRLSTELGDTERVPARLPSKNARHPDAARPLALSSRIEGVQ